MKYPGWRFEAPFAHVAAVAVGERGSLRAGDVLGEERVVGSFRTVQRQRAAVARRGGEPGVDERFPVVGVDQDVGELAASAKNANGGRINIQQSARNLQFSSEHNGKRRTATAGVSPSCR